LQSYLVRMERESTDHQPGMPFNGRREMQELAIGALEALQRAGLHDEVRLLHDRVLSRPPAELMERLGIEGDPEFWTFKPMVELLLREVRTLAFRQERSLDDRRHELAWLLDIAGF
jgi:hypothetical protein